MLLSFPLAGNATGVIVFGPIPINWRVTELNFVIQPPAGNANALCTVSVAWQRQPQLTNTTFIPSMTRALGRSVGLADYQNQVYRYFVDAGNVDPLRTQYVLFANDLPSRLSDQMYLCVTNASGPQLFGVVSVSLEPFKEILL